MICYCNISNTMIDILDNHQGMALEVASEEASRILSNINCCESCSPKDSSVWHPLITLAIANKKPNFQIRDLKIDRALRRFSENKWFSPKDASTIVLALDVLNIEHNPQSFTVKLSARENKDELETLITRHIEMGYLWKALSKKQRERVKKMGYIGSKV